VSEFSGVHHWRGWSDRAPGPRCCRKYCWGCAELAEQILASIQVEATGDLEREFEALRLARRRSSWLNRIYSAGYIVWHALSTSRGKRSIGQPRARKTTWPGRWLNPLSSWTWVEVEQCR